MNKNLIAGVVLAAGLAAAQPANALVTASYNFTSATNTPTTPYTDSHGNLVTYGNTLSWTSNGITVTAAAWSLPYNATATTLPTKAYLGDYTYGLGVTNQYEDGSYPEHTIDNESNYYDFVTLTFSTAVQITSGSLVPFTGDNDAWVSFTMTPGAVTNPTVWANMILHQTEALGNLSSSQNYSTSLNPGGNTGTTWIIGADKLNTKDNDDGFKLATLNVQIPVPEPAAWGMMIAGIGMAGGALRRRRTATLRFA